MSILVTKCKAVKPSPSTVDQLAPLLSSDLTPQEQSLKAGGLLRWVKPHSGRLGSCLIDPLERRSDVVRCGSDYNLRHGALRSRDFEQIAMREAPGASAAETLGESTAAQYCCCTLHHLSTTAPSRYHKGGPLIAISTCHPRGYPCISNTDPLQSGGQSALFLVALLELLSPGVK